MQSLFEKLQLKDEKNLLIQGLPSSIEKQFVKLSYAKNVTPLLKIRKIDFALVFAIHHQQMCNILKEVFPALHPESKLRIAYPKTASKIASDLNRDGSCHVLSDKGYEAVREVPLDHVWTAMRFQKMEEVEEETVEVNFKSASQKDMDVDKRLVAAPAELETFFIKNKKAQEFFTSLSSNNQKEYVSWIEGAKRSDTKQRRLAAVQEKLLAGKKHPTEK